MKYLERQHPKEVTTNDVRDYLKTFDGLSPYTYSNALKAIKVFFRDYMKAGYLVESFRFPSIAYNPIMVPSARAPWRWSRMSKRINIHVSPTVLRAWFPTEMGELGVQDRYIDAFCGRVPKSILARHYTDYSPERLKRIYDKAGLRVLS